jgi:hypothetical protein
MYNKQTKTNTNTKQRTVPYAEAKEFCDSVDLKYYEVSAKTGVNCESALASLLYSIHDRVVQTDSSRRLTNVSLSPRKTKDPRNCEVQ